MSKTWKRALVTGASSGIGKAFAEKLASEKCDLVLVARDIERLEELAVKLERQYQVEVEVLAADLADDIQISVVENRLEDTNSPIDLLVNNAGMGSHGSFNKSDIEHEIKVVKVNIIAVQRLSHAAANAMIKKGKGYILNVSSVASFGPSPTVATYAASKAFVSSFSQAIAVELEPQGVVVSCVCPGLTKTEFQRRSKSDSNKVPSALWLSPEEVAEESLSGLLRAKSLNVPTIKYKIYTKVLKFVPASFIFKFNKALKRK